MSSSRTVVPSQRLRIAIGLTALKFKPPEQSIQSYTLELKHHFRYSAPWSRSSEECDAWRDRVVALEAELQTTRAAASSEHIELLALKSMSAQKCQVSEPTTSASKKKGRPPKKPRRTSDPKKTPVLGVCLPSKRKTPEPCASQSSSPPPRRINRGLFSSLHALDAAVSVAAATTANSPPDAALVAAATIRCIDVLHGLLVRATSSLAQDTPLDPTPREALNGIERTLPHVLRTAMSTLDGADVDPLSAARLRWHTKPTEGHDPAQCPAKDTISALDLVLGGIATSLLVPAIRAIVPCTLAKTEHILSSRRPTSPSSKRGESADGADLLGVVSAALEALPGQPYIALHDRVALEAVRALTSLIVDQPSQQQGEAQRIHRLARKDALHFLCDAALLSLRRTAPGVSPPGSAGELLGSALEAALGELALPLSAREGGNKLDIVEEQRVLVVLERAWSVGRRVGNIGGDAGGDERMDAGQSDVHGRGVDATMTDVDKEDQDQRRGSDIELTADGS